MVNFRYFVESKDISIYQPISPLELAQRLAAIVNSSDDAIVSTDCDGTITTWNKAATQLFGFRDDEVLGQSTLLITPPELYDDELSKLEKVRAGHRIEHYETQRLRKGGGRIDVSLTISPIENSEGKVIGASIITRDIASQKQSEDARLRLAAIVESSDDAIISKKLNGIITSWNAGAERMFGYSPEEMIGHSIMTLIPPELQHEEAEIIRKLSGGNRIEHFETQRLKKGGERVHVSLTISPIRDSSGRVVGASKIARDISERRRIEETRLRMAAIVESSDDGIISKDMDGIITSWNAGAQRIFGYEPHEIIGHSVLRLIPRELRSEEPMILARLRAGNRVDHYESKRVAKDGQVLDVSLTISPIRDSTGKVVGASKIVRDITARKRAEAAIIERERSAAAGRMAASLAHEVNNPLEAIMNLAYLLDKDQALSPTARTYADLLLQEVQRASEITRQTLSFYRGATEAADVELKLLIDAILLTKKDAIANRHIRITQEVKGVGVAWGYSGEIRQVLSNILDNAIQAVGENGHIRIRVRDLTKSRAVRVSVCDDGPGMSRSTLKRAFEPFFTTKANKGSGLGLWVSRGILEKHGSSIQIRTNQSPERHGTIFSIILPRTAAPTGEIPARSSAAC